MSEFNYTFRNSGEKENNDIIYGELFELQNNSYAFVVHPKTKFWRLGIRLSKTQNIEFDLTKPRHINSNFPDIHLGVGYPNVDNGLWGISKI